MILLTEYREYAEKQQWICKTPIGKEEAECSRSRNLLRVRHDTGPGFPASTKGIDRFRPEGQNN